MPNIPGILRFRRNIYLFGIGTIVFLFVTSGLLIPAYQRGDLGDTLAWLFVANVAGIVSMFGAHRLWRA